MAFESKYKEEDNWGEITDCSADTLPGTKASTRPQQFCKPVTCLDTTTCDSTLDVTGQTTLNKTEVIPPEITVGGQVFVPKPLLTLFDGGVIGADGVVPTPSPFTILVSEG